MNKIFLYNLLYIISILLATAFCVTVAVDSYRYSHSFYSAPFYIFVFARAITFLLPSLVSFVIGKIIRKKS